MYGGGFHGCEGLLSTQQALATVAARDEFLRPRTRGLSDRRYWSCTPVTDSGSGCPEPFRDDSCQATLVGLLPPRLGPGDRGACDAAGSLVEWITPRSS